jgi:hypothetical protein
MTVSLYDAYANSLKDPDREATPLGFWKLCIEQMIEHAKSCLSGACDDEDVQLTAFIAKLQEAREGIMPVAEVMHMKAFVVGRPDLGESVYDAPPDAK